MWSELKLRLFAREDSEHVQILIRIGIVAFLVVYFSAVAYLFPEDPAQFHATLVTLALSMLASFALLAWIIAKPRKNALRRVTAAIHDNVVLTLCLFLSGELAAPCIGLFLWITLGYGFRYGTQYLNISQILSLVGFAAVWATEDFWRSNPVLSAAMMFTLVVIPRYAASLIGLLHAEKARAEEHSRAKSAFVAMMSHEFRTPLHGIIGHTQLLELTPLNAEQTGYLRNLRSSSAGLLDLVESVLDISRIESGNHPVTLSLVDLHELLTECMSTVDVQAQSRHLRMRLDVDPVIPRQVWLDKRSIREILLNLLGNAVKFTDSGSIELTVSHGQFSPSEFQLRFCVRDSGIGIAEDKFDRVFVQFSQIHTSTDRSAAGAGLGTTIARDLARRMGGDILLRSDLGRGTSFEVEIPVKGSLLTDRPKRDHQTVLIIGMFGTPQHAVVSSFQQLGFDVVVEGQLDLALDRLNDLSKELLWVLAPESIGLQAARHIGDALRAAAPHVVSRGHLVSITNVSALSADFAEAGFAASVCSEVSASELAALTDGHLVSNDLASLPVLDPIQNDVDSSEDDVLAKAKAMLRGQQFLRVLLVDDNSVNRLMMATWLEKLGIEHAIATSGYEFLEKAADGSFDLFLIDHQMPDLDGLEALNLYRTAASDPVVPAVLVSADVRKETIARALRVGFTAIAPKPLRLEGLVRAMVDAFAPRSVPLRVEDLDARRLPAGSTAASAQPESQPSDADDDLLVDPTQLLGVIAVAKADSARFGERLIQAYADDAVEVFAHLRQSLETGDYPALWDAAHALKGNSMNLGAHSAAALCETLEQMKPEELRDSGAVLLSRLEDIVARSVAALRATRPRAE